MFASRQLLQPYQKVYENNYSIFEKTISRVIEVMSGSSKDSPMVNPTFMERFIGVALTFFANASATLDVQDQQI